MLQLVLLYYSTVDYIHQGQCFTYTNTPAPPYIVDNVDNEDNRRLVEALIPRIMLGHGLNQ